MNGINEKNAHQIPGAPVSTTGQPSLPQENDPVQYPVYPEDDGADRPRNPFSPV